MDTIRFICYADLSATSARTTGRQTSRSRTPTLRAMARSTSPSSQLEAPRPLLLVLLALSLSAAAAAPRRPHIILIVADDLGWNDVSVHGSQLVATPNIDALAASGRLLRRHYALPTCTPSRAALLTGRHAAATGMQGYPLRAGEPRGLPLEERTLAERLRARGYATHLVGKWHLGAHRSAFLPTRRGFDSHFGYRNGYVGYFDHSITQATPDKLSLSGLDVWRDESPAEAGIAGQYLTEALTAEAVRLVRAHAAAAAANASDPQPRPLFLQLAHMSAHTGRDDNPLEVPDEQAAHRRFAYEPDPERRLYAEMVSQLDKSVGTVLDTLRETGMLNDSIVVFISDNGGMTAGMHHNTGSNWPFRGTKHTLFEGGVRTVGAVWSKQLRAPRSPYDHPLHVSDWAPTLLDAADAHAPAPAVATDRPSDEDIFAGVSHWQALSAPAEEVVTPPRENLLLNVDDPIGLYGVLAGRWKYVEGTYDSGAYDGHLGSPARGGPYPAYDAQATADAARALDLDSAITADDVLNTLAAAAVSCHGLQNTLGFPPCLAGCLFDLQEDPCETRDASARDPAQLLRMRELLAAFRAKQAPQLNAPVDPKADPALHGGVWAPWLDDDDDGISRRALPTAADASTTTLVATTVTVAAARSIEL